ncbi:MAG: S1 RNA-binding domain-containing protein [Lachnospiraceae bacterium]|nr:S1 RNA-binding domain-containing protein [Lachnospiraceae bacterium]
MPNNLTVGAIVEGKVVKIKPFGAIVSLGGNMQGLVHISQIKNSFIQDINEHISIGDIVKVKVLSIDEETNKIALSIKDALPKEATVNQREQRPNFENKYQNVDFAEKRSPVDFEDKLKDWLKQANERQAGLNKRNNKR